MISQNIIWNTKYLKVLKKHYDIDKRGKLSCQEISNLLNDFENLNENYKDGSSKIAIERVLQIADTKELDFEEVDENL